jgi:cytochrome c553
MRASKIIIPVLLLAPLTLGACGKKDAEKPVEPKVEAKVEDAAKTPATAPTTDAGLKAHMKEHFEAIRQIERAIVVGDSETAKQQATWLAEHAAQGEIAEYADEIKAVQDAAKAVAESDSMETMASGAAKLAGLCGHCHLVTTSIASFEWTEAPKESGEAKERMQRHLWAMDRLWEGLVGPSEMSWQEGTKVLLAKPFPVDALPVDDKAAPAAKAQLEKIPALAKKASTAVEIADRTKVYAELLGTCSSCHAKTR